MSGLKPFRTIPRDIVEWTRWMRDQNIGSTTTTITNTDGSTTTTTTSADRWTIKDFSGNYTAQSGDADTVFLRSTSGSATNLTIPKSIFDKGAQINVIQYGAGALTVVAGSGATIRTPNALVLLSQYATATLIHMGNSEWFIAGRI